LDPTYYQNGVRPSNKAYGRTGDREKFKDGLWWYLFLLKNFDFDYRFGFRLKRILKNQNLSFSRVDKSQLSVLKIKIPNERTTLTNSLAVGRLSNDLSLGSSYFSVA
jgi:hypothetical protein